jgi:hypothetical protein
MIIARGEKGGHQMIMLGLSEENVRRLQGGKPIDIKRESHGDGVPEGWEIVIFVGETEQSMKKELESLGAIGPETKITVDPRL